MQVSRYTRDAILIQGLELASSPTVSRHDMPLGTIDAGAYSIKWLQNALDMFHRKYPFSGDLKLASMNIPANTLNPVLDSDPTKYFPTDYIIDVRNGFIIILADGKQRRLQRKGFQYYLSYQTAQLATKTRDPAIYACFSDRIYVSPQPNVTISTRLWYYALPALPGASDNIKFPDEFVLIEFIRLKALEWTRSIEPGAAQAYLTLQLAGFRASGLLDEPEYEDAIPIENNQSILAPGLVDNRNAWMGTIAL